MECRHLDDDPLNNRWAPGDEAATRAAGGNLIWGTKPENVEDTFRNGRQRAAPRLERHCVLCEAVLTTNGKRCHDCVVQLGVDAAGLLRAGHTPGGGGGRAGLPERRGHHEAGCRPRRLRPGAPGASQPMAPRHRYRPSPFWPNRSESRKVTPGRDDAQSQRTGPRERRAKPGTFGAVSLPWNWDKWDRLGQMGHAP